MGIEEYPKRIEWKKINEKKGVNIKKIEVNLNLIIRIELCSIEWGNICLIGSPKKKIDPQTDTRR